MKCVTTVRIPNNINFINTMFFHTKLILRNRNVTSVIFIFCFAISKFNSLRELCMVSQTYVHCHLVYTYRDAKISSSLFLYFLGLACLVHFQLLFSHFKHYLSIYHRNWYHIQIEMRTT